ncbi:MAG: sigma-70 family RNA polymerase sigma factor [Prosthecobacter sp.]|nr:sigma-70 family RNA polymerase sigma factor [Prosthecobacter sp.]
MAAAAFSWKQCFDQVAPNLILYARQIAPTPADAEDVVQLAFVRWWRRFPEGDSQHIPLHYGGVRTIALDMRRSNLRRSARESQSDIALPHADTPIFDPPPEKRETAALVEQALAKLPEEQREVVTLRLWGGLTFAEIAEATGSSVNTVAGRYRYALAALQKHLAPMKEDLASHSSPLPLNSLHFPQGSEALS